MVRFQAELRPVPHGGCYVAVPDVVVAKAGLRERLRVKGKVNGVEYRSSLMKYSGTFHLGVHKTVLKEAKVQRGDKVTVDIEVDNEPLPSDEVPPDLQAAIDATSEAREGWRMTPPASRREHVKQVLDAKKADTRARRVVKVIEACVARTSVVSLATKGGSSATPRRTGQIKAASITVKGAPPPAPRSTTRRKPQ